MKLKNIVKYKVRSYFVSSYFISFPKSGRTWLREVIYQYLGLIYGHDIANLFIGKDKKYPKFQTGNSKIPSIHFTHDVSVAGTANQYRAPYDKLKSFFNIARYKNKKNVFLVRDPRDVLVSYYYHSTKLRPVRGDESVFEGALEDFIKSDIYGIKKIVEFMNLWAPVLSKEPNFLLVNYEDMKQKTDDEFGRILNYLLGEVDHNNLRIALDKSTFENMKKKEQIKYSQAINNDNAMKVRKGIVGGYRSEISAETIKYVDSYIMDSLNQFYEKYRYRTMIT